MCGHLGFSFLEPQPGTAAMMATMAVFMDKRGGHSWGYWADNLGIVKGMGDMAEELNCHVFKDSKQVIAHCRWATHGAQTVENSHPFHQGRIIGAHNGVITNHDDLNKMYPERDFDVDSQHIFQHINDGQDLAELSGYGATVWTDTDLAGCINFCKFNGGSFEVAHVYNGEDFVGTVWSSTTEALRVGLKQLGLNYKELQIHQDQEYVIKDSKAEEITGKKIAIAWASKWSKNPNYGYGTGGSSASNGGTFPRNYPGPDDTTFPGWERTHGGAWRYVGNNPTQSEEQEEASGDVGEHEFVQALFEASEAESTEAAARDADRRLRTGDYAGEDVDRLIRNLWKTSGTFYHKGKCFSCGAGDSEVVKHRELGVRLCFDCAYEWEETNTDNTAPAEDLRRDFIAQVASKRGVSTQSIEAALEMTVPRHKKRTDIVDMVRADDGTWFEVLQTPDGPVMGSQVRLAGPAEIPA